MVGYKLSLASSQ